VDWKAGRASVITYWATAEDLSASKKLAEEARAKVEATRPASQSSTVTRSSCASRRRSRPESVPYLTSRKGCLRRRSQSAALVVGDREVRKTTILPADVAATLPFTRVSAGSQAAPCPDRLPHPAVTISGVQPTASSRCSYRRTVPIVAGHDPQPLRSLLAGARKEERETRRAGRALVRKSKLVRLWLPASSPLGARRCDSGRRPGLGRRTSASRCYSYRLAGDFGGATVGVEPRCLADEPMGKTRQRALASLRSSRWDTPPPSSCGNVN
jgi:hypothetical protein